MSETGRVAIMTGGSSVGLPGMRQALNTKDRLSGGALPGQHCNQLASYYLFASKATRIRLALS
jgi:hypothetical protein